MVVPEDPAQHLPPLRRVLAAELAGFLGDVVLNDAGLGQFDVAVDQHRRLAHDIDVGAVFGRAGLAVEEVDLLQLPPKAGKFERERRLVGVSAFAEGIELDGHVVSPCLCK